jgi:hypothetical protein
MASTTRINGGGVTAAAPNTKTATRAVRDRRIVFSMSFRSELPLMLLRSSLWIAIWAVLGSIGGPSHLQMQACRRRRPLSLLVSNTASRAAIVRGGITGCSAVAVSVFYKCR